MRGLAEAFERCQLATLVSKVEPMLISDSDQGPLHGLGRDASMLLDVGAPLVALWKRSNLVSASLGASISTVWVMASPIRCLPPPCPAHGSEIAGAPDSFVRLWSRRPSA